ncbi:hypothetical protein GGH91_000782 [Coemansia sp. RSA 2671]|uniref:Uncharacterized protein n=1 Tax=Coemansia linderi TaxID=2663919 RepID=A0ACC1K0Q7_9FUNG|nr:hypothetical protein LPJ60_001938 [Coemansia sp. RSA 2675]KAJ2024526.1 hypothetical protein GGI06_000956 [Coemansia sp. S85]KAJ2029636.1 hypothetical protein IWW57_001600 [Coemansia sp. S610]KAJ2349484.1 hypothetical protein GGH91_000782 [Coemansia sp. RSA 2671]KAJ2413468.1 hypothetical protein GGI10_003039 [Coemansia sp. RSA 2530]KAJ2702028.1 hypothetical protein H4218_001115 [Coemansia sp. IMI 209128]KAJ2771087.1 hypothetical protein GGI18_005098 [Coemansia linderi]
MSDITGVLGWLFLPQFAANLVLKTVHWVLLRVSPRLVPHQSTSAYVLHQRLSYALVIVIYLLYTMWSTERDLGNNFYHAFGLSPSSFSESQLRRNFRQVSLRLHPDKNPEGHQQFIILQHAYKVLSNPLSRFAYDHAGPAAVACQSCKTASDYMLMAIPRRLSVYLAYTMGCVAMQVFRVGKYGAFWQYIAIGGFAALELTMMTSTKEPGIIRALLLLAPHRTSYEMAQILQQVMVCFFIALNQIVPQFVPQEKNESSLELAKQLATAIEATKAEVGNKSRRLADVFRDSGLERHMADEFREELQLSMTLASSAKFQAEFADRLNASRQASSS